MWGAQSITHDLMKIPKSISTSSSNDININININFNIHVNICISMMRRGIVGHYTRGIISRL